MNISTSFMMLMGIASAIVSVAIFASAAIVAYRNRRRIALAEANMKG